MRRLVICLVLAAAAAATAIGCGFGLADDTGQPIPGQYWGWVCPNGDAPEGDAGCLSIDGDSGGAGSTDAGVANDGPRADR